MLVLLWSAVRAGTFVLNEDRQGGAEMVAAGPDLAGGQTQSDRNVIKVDSEERKINLTRDRTFQSELKLFTSLETKKPRSPPVTNTDDLPISSVIKLSHTKARQIDLGRGMPDKIADHVLASTTAPTYVANEGDLISTSAWLLIRGGADSPSLAPAGQLGASQAGMRVQLRAFDIGTHLEFGVNGRVSGALGSPHQLEGALGAILNYKGAIPVQVIAERRQNLGSGGRNAFALILATGIDEKPIIKGFRLSGYGQAGIVGANKRNLFVDGSLRIERGLRIGALPTIRIGGGAWGAAQTGAARLDVGPRISTNVDVSGVRLNIGAEWRQRVLGNASPGSGPVLVIGTDFSR